MSEFSERLKIGDITMALPFSEGLAPVRLSGKWG